MEGRRPRLGRQLGRELLLCAALASVAVLALPAVAGAAELRVSSTADRANSALLEGADVAANAYIFVTPTVGPTEVRFWLDDPTRAGTPRRTEFGAPWDFAGTAASGQANPFNTTTVPNGTHVVTVEVDEGNPTPTVLNGTFTVSNPFPPEQVHLSWTGDPSTTFTAIWRTRSPATPSKLQYRLPGAIDWTEVIGATRVSGTTPGHLNEVTASTLMPDSAYEYRVLGDGGQWSSVYSTRTAPQGSGGFDAIFVSDTGIVGRPDGLTTGTQQVIDQIALFDPLVLLLGGDYAQRQGDTRYTNDNSAIDAWFVQEQQLLRRTPGMPTYGDREETFEDHDAWASRFALPAGHDSSRLYSFDVGNVHFISILATSNPHELPLDAMTWLQGDIDAAQAAGKQWIVPYMHQPAFSSGTNHGSNFELRNQLGPLFEAEGVKLVLSSHDESYERSFPLANLGGANNTTSDGLSCYGPTDGITWVKTGPGGKLSNVNGGFSPFTNPRPYWSAVRDNTKHHFLRLRAFGNGIRVESWGIVGNGSTPELVDSFLVQNVPCTTTYARPGSASPLRVPLAMAYAECTEPNSTHVGPLDYPSCTAANRESQLLTTGTTGLANGFVRMTVVAGNVATPEDEADFGIEVFASDVRNVSGGTDYTGDVMLSVPMRITDRATEKLEADPATTSNFNFSVPVQCLETAGTAGSTCSISTTADTLVPGTAREGRRAIMSAYAIELKDAGADGIVDDGATCPYACGTGDESVFLREGIFTP